MIFQPAIIALLLAAGLSLAMLATASPFAVQLIRHWDLGSGSERQLRLERLTYLFSMMVALVCGLQILSTLLFVFNADKMSVMFVGAMCAVGASSVVAFFAALMGIVAFVSLYIYEHPHHHCPFCILKPEYDYQGYLLYVPLFAAAAAVRFVAHDCRLATSRLDFHACFVKRRP